MPHTHMPHAHGPHTPTPLPQALVRDCRPNALAVAAAGGIAPLAALLEAAAEPQPGLWRRCVDLWLGLGGLPALGKLLGHKVSYQSVY